MNQGSVLSPATLAAANLHSSHLSSSNPNTSPIMQPHAGGERAPRGFTTLAPFPGPWSSVVVCALAGGSFWIRDHHHSMFQPSICSQICGMVLAGAAVLRCSLCRRRLGFFCGGFVLLDLFFVMLMVVFSQMTLC